MAKTYFVTGMTKDYLWKSERLRASFPLLKSCDPYVMTVGFDMPGGDNFKTVRLEPTAQKSNQQGQFLDVIPTQDDDVVIMADADSCVQRDLTPAELEQFHNLDGVLGMGANSHFGQDALFEFNLCKPKVGPEVMEHVLGLKLKDLVVYNVGLCVAKPPVWRRLRQKYEEIWAAADALCDNWRVCQLIQCAAAKLVGIDVVPLNYTVHSHQHFGLRRGHSFRDGVLYFGDEVVFFPHAVEGLWGPRKVPILTA